MDIRKGDGYGNGYGYGYAYSLLPEYDVSALSLPWAIANVGLERGYAWT